METCAVTHPRQEPYAGKPHVRIWAGGVSRNHALPSGGASSSRCSAARRRRGRSRRARSSRRCRWWDFSTSQSADGYKEPLRGFRQGLKEQAISRAKTWRLNTASPRIKIDLCRCGRRPSPPAAGRDRRCRRSACGGQRKGGYANDPYRLHQGDDPVRLGYVASLPRSGGNLTGISFFNAELATKRLELLRALVPSVLRIAVLLDPHHCPGQSMQRLRDLEPAARAMGDAYTGRQCQHQRGRSIRLFASFARERGGRVVCRSRCLLSRLRRVQFWPNLRRVMASPRSTRNVDHVDVGGLMSYGTKIQRCISSGSALTLAASSRAPSPPPPCGRVSSSDH